MSDDVLHGEHHAQCHFPLYHQRGHQSRDYYVLGLVYQYRSRVLVLPQRKAPDVHFEQPCLYAFPFPPLLLLAGTQLYLLHAVHQLHHRALVGALLGKPLVVQFRPFLHEEPDVGDVECAPSHEDKENHAAVHQQHDAEYQDVEGGERHAEAASGQEVLYARVVVDALQDVARHLGVEVAHRELHHLDEEVRNQGDVDACAQMQQYPSAYELHGAAAEGQHQLGNEHQVDKSEILVVDAEVHDALREEGEHQLYHAAQQQPQQQLSHQLLVGAQVRIEEAEAFIVCLFPLIFVYIEFRCRFQQQCHSRIFSVRFGAEPATAEFFPGVFQLACSGVGHPYMLVVHPVDHDEMLLVPVDDTR